MERSTKFSAGTNCRIGFCFSTEDCNRASDCIGELKPVSMKTFDSGAKSSVEKPRYDLVELRAMELIAGRMKYGAERHGARNYRKGATDATFVTDRINHLIEHCHQFAEHRRTSDLAAIGANFNILAGLNADTAKDGADGKGETSA